MKKTTVKILLNQLSKTTSLYLIVGLLARANIAYYLLEESLKTSWAGIILVLA